MATSCNEVELYINKHESLHKVTNNMHRQKQSAPLFWLHG